MPIEQLADLLGHTDTNMLMRHYRKPLRAAYSAGLEVARLRVAARERFGSLFGSPCRIAIGAHH